MKIKTSELTGAALDWAVAKCEGIQDSEFVRTHMDAWTYSTDWAQGGPIIEREGGTLWSTNADGWRYKACYDFANDKEGAVMHGPAPLIAAMRCYVASKLGEEVEVPEELAP